MRPRILLVNPPVYDFTAYDFWLRPYGMLRVAGRLRHVCELVLFDFMVSRRRDAWGRGRFDAAPAEKPPALGDIPRNFRRFGRPRDDFVRLLSGRVFDFVLIQTSMTYWYPGVREVIEDVRRLQSWAKIVLGGVYATLCPAHARALGADLVVSGSELGPLWQLLSVEPGLSNPYWAPGNGDVGAIKLTEGCPFRCTYCSAPLLWPGFRARPAGECLEELMALAGTGVRNVAFYDDALLFQPQRTLIPFLEAVENSGLWLHTPNALHAKFFSSDLARRMVRANVKTFFFGLEGSDAAWQQSTGGKVAPEEFSSALQYLREAGAGPATAYVLVGHPESDRARVEASIRFARQCGAQVLLSEFSPIPGTVDGAKSEPWADMSEPLAHNKTAFAIRRLGPDRLDRLKTLARSLNASPA